MEGTNFHCENITPELSAKLMRRWRMVEGPRRSANGVGLCNGATSVSGLSSVSSAPAIDRLPLFNTAGVNPGRHALTPRSTNSNNSHTTNHNGSNINNNSNNYNNNNSMTFNESRQAQQLQFRVGLLTRRNEELSMQVNKMKHQQQVSKDGEYDLSKIGNHVLTEPDQLIAEMHKFDIQKERDDLEDFKTEDSSMTRARELEAECFKKHTEEGAVHLKSLQCLQAQVSSLQQHAKDEESKAAKAEKDNQSLRDKIAELEKEKQHLSSQLDQARMERDHQTELARAARSEPSTPSVSSESRLRAVMMNNSSSLEEMREAIASVRAYVDEAHREYASKLLRERRAAFENLHLAIERADETVLEKALIAARRVEVEEEDIQKGEAKLAELKALTDEQRREKAAQKLETQRKKDAFLLVKKDHAEQLASLIASLEPDVRWQDWRDYAGRTLWSCSQQLRAVTVQELLAPKLGLRVPNKTPRQKPSECEPPAATNQRQETSGDKPPEDRTASSNSAGTTSEQPRAVDPVKDEPETIKHEKPQLSPEEEGKLKLKGLRAVVQDNCAALSEVLDIVPVETWSKWHNKAGEDLLTLSQKRGSAGAETLLSKALGMVEEIAKEEFEERQSVWVFLQGEVQPRRATVLEDTPQETDDVLLEYWDGDAPPERVEKCLVRKMFV